MSQNERIRVPRHVAIIMDGNGRWARERGLERVEGHAEGARAVRDAVETAARIGVEYLTLYAFSVANWARPRGEVEALMRLLVDFAKKERSELRSLGIRVNVIGALEDLPTTTRHAVEDLMRYTADGGKMTLTLALSYGGRQDIVEAARALAVRAELVFLPIMWPDFRPATLLEAIESFSGKERRFGRTSEQVKKGEAAAFDPLDPAE